MKQTTQETNEGSGVIVKRLMPVAGLRNFDPFVLWDHFTITPGSGFPEHPHRGFEAITYMFVGSMQHTDNLGNQSTVTSGGAQRFTAGSGIVHSEMPANDEQSEGIQLWINLSRANKACPPAYQQVDAKAFPEEIDNGVTVRTIVGSGSPLELRTAVRYQAISLDANAQFSDCIETGFRGFIYLVSGSIKLNGNEQLNTGEAWFFEDTGKFTLHADEPSLLMLCFGQPHSEPIHQHGPFVD